MKKRHILSFEEARARQETRFGLLVYSDNVVAKNGTESNVLSIAEHAKSELRVLNGFSQFIASGHGVPLEE